MSNINAVCKFAITNCLKRLIVIFEKLFQIVYCLKLLFKKLKISGKR